MYETYDVWYKPCTKIYLNLLQVIRAFQKHSLYEGHPENMSQTASKKEKNIITWNDLLQNISNFLATLQNKFHRNFNACYNMG